MINSDPFWFYFDVTIVLMLLAIGPVYGAIMLVKWVDRKLSKPRRKYGRY
jgi:hypothetical protein